jgi:hypothetical protein
VLTVKRVNHDVLRGDGMSLLREPVKSLANFYGKLMWSAAVDLPSAPAKPWGRTSWRLIAMSTANRGSVLRNRPRARTVSSPSSRETASIGGRTRCGTPSRAAADLRRTCPEAAARVTEHFAELEIMHGARPAGRRSSWLDGKPAAGAWQLLGATNERPVGQHGPGRLDPNVVMVRAFPTP